jgi:hypothetical protein
MEAGIKNVLRKFHIGILIRPLMTVKTIAYRLKWNLNHGKSLGFLTFT